MAKMTPVEFATQLEKLIAQARAGEMPDEVIIAGLEEAIEAIQDELKPGP
jgi:hypothetical protein